MAAAAAAEVVVAHSAAVVMMALRTAAEWAIVQALLQARRAYSDSSCSHALLCPT
jgi:hypothetical protein